MGKYFTDQYELTYSIISLKEAGWTCMHCFFALTYSNVEALRDFSNITLPNDVKTCDPEMYWFVIGYPGRKERVYEAYLACQYAT